MRSSIAVLLLAIGCSKPAPSTPPEPAPIGPAERPPVAASAREAAPLEKSERQLDYDARVAALRARLPAHFSIVVEPPFVVVGDGGEARVRRTAEHTIRWAVQRLERDFFDRRPERILDVYLFEGADSYERHTRALFGEEPSTPYGFYSSRHNALIMNIATGGGTLVHEIVHPYIEANFPDCPAWLNEGLGSLYEQSADRDGHIVGLTNWRLSGLQRAIRAGRTISFEKLTGMSDAEFYADDSGIHYAQARYLLYFLQENGLLRQFYRAFFARRAEDPSGYRTLRETLRERDMASFQKRWERYVAALSFP